MGIFFKSGIDIHSYIYIIIIHLQVAEVVKVLWYA